MAKVHNPRADHFDRVLCRDEPVFSNMQCRARMEARSEIKDTPDADKRRESTAVKSFKGTVQPVTETPVPLGSPELSIAGA